MLSSHPAQYETLIKLSLTWITTRLQELRLFHAQPVCLSDLNQGHSCVLVWLTGLLSCSETLRLFYVFVMRAETQKWFQNKPILNESSVPCISSFLYIIHWRKTGTEVYSPHPTVINSACTFCLLCSNGACKSYPVFSPVQANSLNKPLLYHFLELTNLLELELINLWLSINWWKLL